MTHGIEKQVIERQLQDSIIDAIRSHTGCTRISGFIRIECSEELSYEFPILYEFPLSNLPLDAGVLPNFNLSLMELSNGVSSSIPASGTSSRADSPASASPMPKVNRRKAYQPKRVTLDSTPADLDSDPIHPLDPQLLQASVTEALAPSMAVFPTPTAEYVKLPPYPPQPPQQPTMASLPSTMSLLPPSAKPQGRQRNRTIRPKVPGTGGRSSSGPGGVNGGTKRSPNKEFTCNQCQDKFRSLNSLTEHTTAVHQCFRCTTCNAKFTQRSNLQRHSLKHLGFKPFKCAICRKEYYRKDHLVRHVEVSHPGSDPKGSIVNVLPSAECLRLAEVERKLKAAAAAAAMTDGAVDLSINGQSTLVEERSVTPLVGSTPSSAPSNLTLEEEEEDTMIMEDVEDDVEDTEMIEEDDGVEPTDLSRSANGSFHLSMMYGAARVDPSPLSHN